MVFFYKNELNMMHSNDEDIEFKNIQKIRKSSLRREKIELVR